MEGEQGEQGEGYTMMMRRVNRKMSLRSKNIRKGGMTEGRGEGRIGDEMGQIGEMDWIRVKVK